MELSFVYVPVDDLAAAATFYRDVLGLQEAWREGEDTIAYAVPGGPTQLMVSTDPLPAGPMHLVDDLTAWLGRHPEVQVAVERFEIPGGSVVGLRAPADNVCYVFDQTDDGAGPDR